MPDTRDDDLPAGKALSHLPDDDRRRALLLAEAARRFGREGFRIADRILAGIKQLPEDDEAFLEMIAAKLGR